jgi:serine/threonine protein kinase
MVSLARRDDQLAEVLARYLTAADRDRAPPPQALLALYPDLADGPTEFFADQDRLEAFAAPLRSAVRGVSPAPAGVVLGSYRLDEEIGRGGMGVVYRAWDADLNRTVAVKTIRAPGLAGREALARFRAEAVAVARLQHPNIVQVFEAGEHDGW